MASREFLEEMWAEAKKLLPGWMYASLYQAARPRSGGKAKANRAKEKQKENELLLTDKAVWSRAYINDLPDSAFLYIQPGGNKDSEGKTVPRTNRHFPVKDEQGDLDLPHLRNALARLSQSDAPGLDENEVRARAERMLEEEQKGISKALISFVVSELSPIEKARQTPLVGTTGQLFKELYLDPLGVDRDDVHITIDKNEIEDINPRLVIALGKTAKEYLGDWADYMLPHPEAIRKHGDSGEVGRKLKSIHKVLFDKYSKNVYFNNRHRRAKKEPIVEYKSDFTSFNFPIIKSATIKRIVYGVVSDPYGANGAEEDAHNDWISPDTIEKMAHDYLKESRIVGLQHKEKASAKVVESWIEQYPNREEYLKAIQGKPHKVTRRQFGDDTVHSGSWIMGVELSDKEWSLYEKGEINAFSIGARGIRESLKRSEMPKVTFVNLIESEQNA